MATTKKTTNEATRLRRCTGSARFGIEPHETPVSDFPKQPSRKDGLGTMCAEHWKAYVKGLTADRKARMMAAQAPDEGAASGAAVDAAIAREAKAKQARAERRAAPRRAKAARAVKAPDPKVVEAEDLIAEVDALPGPEHVKRVGDGDVQAALETVAAANGHGRESAEKGDDAPDDGKVLVAGMLYDAETLEEAEPVETTLSETIDGGTEEADAA